MILGPLARARFYSVSVHKRSGDVIEGALAQVEKPVLGSELLYCETAQLCCAVERPTGVGKGVCNAQL